MQRQFGRRPAKEELDHWYDIKQLDELRKSLVTIGYPLGLYHCVRLPWIPPRGDSLADPDLQCELNRKLRDDWDEFLGPVPTFSHEVEDEDGAYRQSCYYGNQEKLQDYIALVNAVFPLLPSGFLHRIDYQRDARIDGNLWSLGLYRQASLLPWKIALDGRGEGAYQKWRMDSGLGLGYFRDPAANSSARRGIEKHWERLECQGTVERSARPTFVYLAIQSDLCSATAAVIDQFIREFNAGGHRPIPTAVIFDPPETRAFHASSGVGRSSCAPDGGWHFPPGEFSFAGVTGELVGKQRDLLETLVRSGRKTYAKDLEEEFGIERASLRGNISKLNTLLRETFGLDKRSRPIARSGEGRDLTYQLNLNLLKSGQRVPLRWRETR